MRFAIDRYIPGKEIEVSASDFFGVFIPQKQNRFYCPECGEPVNWRSRGGAHPDVFYHRVKTDRSPECDKRVDGRSDLALYQRVGLPVYLLKTYEGIYTLNIAFPALRQQLFNKLNDGKAAVTISTNNGRYHKRIPINKANFYVDETTLVPINFIPEYAKNYKILVEPQTWSSAVGQKWSDYVDGFESKGAIFTFSENGGKKIRRGDSISIGKKYILLAKRFVSPYGEIHVERIGKIHLNQTEYYVYSFEINMSIENSQRYALINSYIKNAFGVWVLEKTPEVVPLWPPVVERDVLIPVIRSKKLYCSIKSNNDFPNMHKYTGSDVNLIALSREEDGTVSAEIPLREEEFAISVDRKYVGREIHLSQKTIINNSEPRFTNIVSLGNEILDEKAVAFESIKNGFFVSANYKQDLYVESGDKVYQKISIRNEITSVPERRNNKKLLFFMEGHFNKKIDLLHSEKEYVVAENLNLEMLYRHCHGVLVDIPLWATKIINGGTFSKKAKAKIIKNGKIYRGVLVYLMKLKGGLYNE